MQGPGHFVEMGCICPAVTLHCRQTWAANAVKLVHDLMMADQHAVVRRAAAAGTRALCGDGQHVSCCDITMQADLGCKLVQAYALHHDGRPACCGEQGLLQQGPGHFKFVEMGSMCPAVGLHCRQT